MKYLNQYLKPEPDRQGSTPAGARPGRPDQLATLASPETRPVGSPEPGGRKAASSRRRPAQKPSKPPKGRSTDATIAPPEPRPVGRTFAVGLETRETRLGDLVVAYSVYDGRPLDGTWIGFDSETAMIEGDEIPDLALASASSGAENRLIHPDQVGQFVLDHRDRDFIFFNVGFDFWVVVEHLRRCGESEALEAWWRVAADDRMHDAMILDQLTRLARDDSYPRKRNLGEVAFDYAGLVVDKADPYRLRYGEIIGVDWAGIDAGFFEYAIKDPIATLAAYQVMAGIAHEFMEAHRSIRPDALDRFGLLTEAVQVKGSIALAEVERRGIDVEAGRLDALRAGLRARRDELVAELESLPGCCDLFKRDRGGEIKMTPSGDAPSHSRNKLCELFAEAAKAVADDAVRAVLVPRTATGNVSLRADDWEDLVPCDRRVAAWFELAEINKTLQFFGKLEGKTVHPKYSALVRTGRTSCSGPNIQQVPRKGGLREAFIPRPGHLFLVVDYAYIELRTLAAELLARYDSSKLAEVIGAGVDPHCYTAAMFEGMALDVFMAMGRGENAADREQYGTLRQRAKVLNFGIPGGLGARSLVAYARSTYGVTLTLEEAEEFRGRLIHEVYPELGLYLADDAMESLARNLGAPVGECWARFDWQCDRSGAVAGGIRNVVAGKLVKADGQPYQQCYLDGVWNGLVALNRNPELAPVLARRQGDEGLRSRLFDSAVATLTGRIRGRVRFTQARNTPFQGLAADGAKLALFALVRAGYRVVAFIHDEFVIELPEEADHGAEAARIESILNRFMESVTGGVPVDCEYALSRRWSKKAKAVFLDDRLIPYEGDPV